MNAARAPTAPGLVDHPSTKGAFTVWGYGTTSTLVEIMQPDYMFAGPSILTPGI
jgi:hypothetical protein